MIKWDDPDHTGSDHGLSIDDVSIAWTVPAATNTSVQFVSTSSSVAENGTSTNLALAITNFDATNATNVTIAAIGATGRITTFTTPVVFPANNGSNQNCVVNLDNNALCDGDANVTFTITGVTGGTGSPSIGTNASHVLTITDDDVCTSVQFVSTSSSVSEAAGTTNIPLAITNFNAANATSVTIAATGATGRITTFTTPVTFPANNGSDQNCTVTLNNNILCDGDEAVTLTITGISGGGGSPFIGANNVHTLTVQNDDVCTSVQFVATSSAVSEGVGSTNIPLAITNFNAVNPTSVTISATGATGRITSFTTPVVFPANDGSNQNCVVTVDNNLLCDGNENVVLTITGISGGGGSPFIGTNDVHTLTINDNESPVDPVANSGTAVSSSGFTANWTPISGATNYYLDVYTLTPTVTDDFTDGNFTASPTWSGSTSEYTVLTNGTLPSGSASTDGSFIGSTSTTGLSALTIASTETEQWKFSWGTANFSGSSSNRCGVVLMSDAAITSIDDAFDGYYILIGVNGSTDPIELWRSSGLSKTKVGDFPSSPNFASNALQNGLNVRVTRNGSGQFELFYGTGFTYASEPVSSAGTLTDNTHTTSSRFGVFTDFANPSASRRVYLDNIVLGGVPAYVGIYNNSDAGTATSAVIGGLDPSTTYYYVVRATGGCATANTSNEIMVTTDAAVTTYYSQGTGDVSDAIWATTPVGTPAVATFDATTDMVVQNGHVVTSTNSEEVQNLTVEVGGTLVLETGTNMNVNGPTVVINGTLSPAVDSDVSLVSNATTSLSTTGTASFYNLNSNVNLGVTVSGNVDIYGTLLLQQGDFDASTATVRLRSTASGTGSLGPIGLFTTYSGDLTVERYIPAGATRWRLLGSPVGSATVADWDDDFITAGFPGSNYPTFDSPVGSGILWPSVREYDETAAGGPNEGLNGVASTGTGLDVAKGFAAWCGDNLGGTGAFTIEVSGPPTIADSPIDFEVNYTDQSTIANDGWNLVSNPLPSAIDFTDVSLGNNMFNGYYVYNPATGNNVVWNEGSGTSFPPGILNGVIASSQGFWLKAIAASPGITSVSESAKVSGNGTGLFGGDQVADLPMVRLRIGSAINSYSDEAAVVFAYGTPGFDATMDAAKMPFHDAAAPMISTMTTEGDEVMVEMYGAYSTDIAIPVKAVAGVSGTYTITSYISGQTLSCLWLEDLQTGSITALTDGATYSFQLAAGTSTTPRFVLHGTAPLPFAAQDGECGPTSGMAEVEVGGTPADVTWTTAAGAVLLSQPNSTGTATYGNIAAGNYTVRVGSTSVCGELTQDFTIATEGTEVEASFTAEGTVLVNEATSFSNSSTAGASYLWNFGDGGTSTEVEPTHTYTVPGTYTVTLTVTLDNCISTTTGTVTATVSTDIATATSTGVNAWGTAQGITVEHGYSTGVTTIEVLDATGRVHLQRQAEGAGRTLLPGTSLTTGIWFVRVSHGADQHSFRVPLVR
ncbi:MAG: PKD domain-containing protein [Flavobacteriales bacterium]